MKKLTLLGLVIVAIAGSQTITASGQAPTLQAIPAPAACTPAKQVYSLKHWHRAHPARGEHVCDTRARDLKKLKELYADYRLYRQVATFPGGAHFGHGPPSPADGRWWAKPWPVICGESRGNFHVNADGGYQIIPSTWAAYGGTAFSSTAGGATPLEQHIVAHRAAQAGEAWYGYKTDC